MSNPKTESLLIFKDLYESMIVNGCAEALFEELSINLTNYMTSDDFDNFVNFCSDEREGI